MIIKFLGHAGFYMKTLGKHLIIDPFITGNSLAEGIIDIKKLKADYILLTHGHGDHIADAETIASNNNATIISNYEIVTWYGQKNIKGHGMNIGGKYSFDFGTVRYTTAIHSSVLPDGTYAGNPGGFIIQNEEEVFYHAGDTALTLDMKLIPQLGYKLDFAILPIGDNFTMGYEDALIAATYLECDIIIGCHFNTFPPITIDTQKASEVFTKAGKKLLIPEVGKIVDVSL
ncbi:MAG TPA: metal-dependent hydrolase [Saprospiraceae bacterium]|nr:metal-dependent hydrolase [Saprospiraceae bacterium]